MLLKVSCFQKCAFAQRSNESPSGAFVAAQTRAYLGRRNRLIMPPAKRIRAFPTRNALLYISLSYADLIASFSSSAILNNVFAICNSRLLPTNQIVNCGGRVCPIPGRTLFLFLWKLMLFHMQRAGHFCERPVQWSRTKPALQILHGPRSSASHRSFSTCPAVHPLILPAQHRLAETSIHLPMLLRRRLLRFLSDGSL